MAWAETWRLEDRTCYSHQNYVNDATHALFQKMDERVIALILVAFGPVYTKQMAVGNGLRIPLLMVMESC